MATIKENFGSGGSGLTPNKSAGTPSLATILREIADDFTAIHASILGITAQLDVDTGVADTDYAANNDPAALLTLKG